MKRVLITGGAGTVGTAFMKRYPDYEYYNVSRNEEQIANLKAQSFYSNDFPEVKNYIADIRSLETLITIFNKVKPDVVIHAAAMKHVNLAEENPTTASTVNVVGSLNVIKASIAAEVPLTIGISTDKACSPDNTYGYTKKIMEQLFFENHTTKNKFVCTRFANVANSNGSVIPFFKQCENDGKPIKLTDENMNRLMFSTTTAAELIHAAMEFGELSETSFILSRKMKNVNMLKLAQCFKGPIQLVGKRPGEKLNETLISESELEYTSVDADDYIFIEPKVTPVELRLDKELSSVTAPDMTQEELKDLIWTKK